MLYILGPVDIELVHVIGGETSIVHPLLKAEGGRPRAFAIYPFSIQQTVGIIILKGIIHIIYNFPIFQVHRFHNRTARHGMHTGADHIEHRTHPDDVNIWNICPYNRIGYSGGIHCIALLRINSITA
ncbi:hypothetical protein D3C73_1018100 [compost metagenome]